jgi:hypothetical protein
MLWRLDVRFSIGDHLSFKTVTYGKRRMIHYLNEQTAEIARSFPNTPDYLGEADFEPLWKAAEQISLEKGLGERLE